MNTSKSKVGSMAIKIDLEKTFDRLEWSFIRQTLIFFNFPPDWITLIMSCITSTSLAVLVNGEHLDTFTPSRGIRQGNPLSPYIFILCMEHLAWLIHNEVEASNWSRIHVSRNDPSFTHLFFANDLMLFAKATNKNFTTINRVLRTFSDISGQKINFNKSRLVLSKRTDPTCATHIKNALDIRLSNHFGKYLGTPILVDGRDKKRFRIPSGKNPRPPHELEGKNSIVGWSACFDSIYHLYYPHSPYAMHSPPLKNLQRYGQTQPKFSLG